MDVNTIQAIISGTIGGAVISLLIWIIKSIFTHGLTLKEIQYGSLYTKRAEVIAQIYSKLVELEHSTKYLVHPLKYSNYSEEKQIEKVVNDGSDFEDYYNKNRVYLTSDVYKKIDSVYKKLRDIYIDWTTYKPNDGDKSMVLDAHKRAELLKKSWNEASKMVPELREDLEKDFHKLLGIKPLKRN